MHHIGQEHAAHVAGAARPSILDDAVKHGALRVAVTGEETARGAHASHCDDTSRRRAGRDRVVRSTASGDEADEEEE